MIEIDLQQGIIKQNETHIYKLGSPEAFSLISQLWLRAGWDSKYVYTFSWLGRPIIQLPEDMLRIQEVIYQIQPDVIVEMGIAHGGSLIFYATLCKAMGRGRVIGVDIEIRPHNRTALEAHELFPYLTLIEGNSIAPDIVKQVRSLIRAGEKVFIVLDSNHTKDHVLAELNAYAEMISPGSYLVAADGIMKDLVGAPRSNLDWEWNNPYQAVHAFLQDHPEFVLEPPSWPFNESNGLSEPVVTYWPSAWLRRK